MKKLANMAAIALCAILLLIGSGLSAKGVGNDQLMAAARQGYRGASLVASGVCVDSFVDQTGGSRCAMEITEVLAGSAQAGARISVSGSFTVGEEYLLYLAHGEDVPYAEDELSYVSVSEKNFTLSGDKVAYGDSSARLADIKGDIEALKTIVSMPSTTYFYDTLASLASGCENVFIGRVERISGFRNVQLRSQAGGTTIEKKLPAADVTIDAYGSVKGYVPYHSTLTMIYAPSMCSSMVNAGTLEPVAMGQGDVMSLQEGATYLFFMGESPDAKQSYAFPINPVQGWVRVDGDALRASEANGVMRAYTDLNDLVSILSKVAK